MTIRITEKINHAQEPKEIHCYGFHLKFKIAVYFYRYHTQLKFMKTSGDQKNKESKIIDSFLDSLWLEQGLSKSTLDAYRSDLKLLVKWARNRELSLENISRPDLLEFIAHKAEQGSSARSSARMLSSMKAFLYPSHATGNYFDQSN